MVCSAQTGADIFTSAIIDCTNGASPLSQCWVGDMHEDGWSGNILL